jgi:hypothetical protein
MKFHHEQKVNIIDGYYNTFKGIIISHRRAIDKANVNSVEYKHEFDEYLVKVIPKKNTCEQKPTELWLRESQIKISWW